MVINIHIPQDQEQTLRNAWGDGLDRAALEALAIEGYRSRKLSTLEVGRLLGIQDRGDVNQWLAERHVPLSYSIDDLESDRKAHDRIVGKSA
jgi:hypothetical protein